MLRIVNAVGALLFLSLFTVLLQGFHIIDLDSGGQNIVGAAMMTGVSVLFITALTLHIPKI